MAAWSCTAHCHMPMNRQTDFATAGSQALLQHRPLPEVPGPGEEAGHLLQGHSLAESALR